MADSNPTHTASGLHDVIVTLPRPAIIALAVVLVAAALVSAWMAARATEQGVQEVAKSVLLILLPMLVVVAAAIGIRRTSTAQVDQLVTAFLEETVLERFALACRYHEEHPYPFSEVELARETFGRSYVEFRLSANCRRCQQHPQRRLPPPTTVWVKMNVINFEVGSSVRLLWPGPLPADALFDRENLTKVFKHPMLHSIAMTIQGSVEEDYKVRAIFESDGDGHVLAHLSFRQKLRDHFLASPFLKRYYAEDATILVGVLFNELAKATLLPLPRAAED
jgi:hypothetical protein